MAQSTAAATEAFRFQAEVDQVLSLVINSLYSNDEIFLRELVSNASDALDKLRYRALTDHELVSPDAPAEIHILPDDQAGTLTIEDFGVGMTRQQLIDDLGTIARSGTREFIAALQAEAEGKASDGAVELIGQFGVGFYSAYLVADKVELVTRAAGEEQAWRWTSEAHGGFTIAPAERATHGTAITLHLKDDAKQYTSTWKLRELVGRYSDFVNHPIKLQEERLQGEGDEQEVVKELSQVNKATALWRRAKGEISDEEYDEFYRHLTRDWQPPLAREHFKVEGTQLFTGLLFVPSKAPFDLYSNAQRRGVRLYVKRVFIMDDCEELLPQWLRFVRGIVDSDDLPLNVSREILQSSRTTQQIHKQIVKKALSMLEGVAKDEDEPERYAQLWETYGPVLKEGLHFAPEHRERLAQLVRYKSSRSDGGWTSLAEYVERMPEGQEAIYYIIAPSLKAAASSPHLEALESKGYEVLYMVDPIDEWAVGGLTAFDGHELASAMKADLDLGEEEDEAKAEQKKEREGALASLLERVKAVLEDRVSEVRLSTRLTDSPSCLVVPEGGLHAYWDKILSQTDQGYQGAKRLFELNPAHPLVEGLRRHHEAGPESEQVAEWIQVLYDQALLTEGSPVEDPHRFAQSLTRLLQAAVGEGPA